jgi:colanic acid biosynthesis glycosyl transferase WcaI
MLKILYTGNMGLGHDLETIILAIARMEGELDFKVVFIGEGKAKQALQKQVEQLKLDNVEFRLPVPLYKLSKLMAEGDIHLVSQKNGTQGLIVPSKIYSILAAGRPSLFIGPQDCEPAIIIKQSKSGFIISPGDVGSAVDAIKILASNEKIRFEMGEHARMYYDEHFGRKRSISRIINAIESIV